MRAPTPPNPNSYLSQYLIKSRHATAAPVRKPTAVPSAVAVTHSIPIPSAPPIARAIRNVPVEVKGAGRGTSRGTRTPIDIGRAQNQNFRGMGRGTNVPIGNSQNPRGEVTQPVGKNPNTTIYAKPNTITSRTKPITNTNTKPKIITQAQTQPYPASTRNMQPPNYDLNPSPYFANTNRHLASVPPSLPVPTQTRPYAHPQQLGRGARSEYIVDIAPPRTIQPEAYTRNPNPNPYSHAGWSVPAPVPVVPKRGRGGVNLARRGVAGETERGRGAGRGGTDGSAIGASFGRGTRSINPSRWV